MKRTVGQFWDTALRQPHTFTAAFSTLAWLGILFAESDHLPSYGLLWFFPILLAVGLSVYFRLPAYARLKSLAISEQRRRVTVDWLCV